MYGQDGAAYRLGIQLPRALEATFKIARISRAKRSDCMRVLDGDLAIAC
jgi:hypothetical protein